MKFFKADRIDENGNTDHTYDVVADNEDQVIPVIAGFLCAWSGNAEEGLRHFLRHDVGNFNIREIDEDEARHTEADSLMLMKKGKGPETMYEARLYDMPAVTNTWYHGPFK